MTDAPRAARRRAPAQHLPARALSHRGFHWLPIKGDRLIAILVVAFVVLAALSLSASVAFHQSLQSFRVIIVEPAIFYVLVVNQARGRRDAATLALALVLAGVAISLVGGWQYLTNERIITAEEGLRRIRGFYGSPNNLGLFLGRALPMAVALALWWPKGRGLLIGAAVVMAVALVLTFSIGAWVAVGGSLLLVAALRGRRMLGMALAAGGGVLVLLVVAALRIPRIGSHFDLQWGTSFIRLNVWESALRMLADHPIRGVGLDNFLYQYQNGYRLPTAWQDPDMSHPHNVVLDFWLSLGLPGVLVLSLLLGRGVELIREHWSTSGTYERGLYAGSLGALADTLLHGMVDNSFFLVDLAVLFWLVFAIVTVVAGSTE
jgi:O-antigen ligase